MNKVFGNIFIGLAVFFLYATASLHYQRIIEKEEARYRPRPVVFKVPVGTVEGDLMVMAIGGLTVVGHATFDSEAVSVPPGWTRVNP